MECVFAAIYERKQSKRSIISHSSQNYRKLCTTKESIIRCTNRQLKYYHIYSSSTLIQYFDSKSTSSTGFLLLHKHIQNSINCKKHSLLCPKKRKISGLEGQTRIENTAKYLTKHQNAAWFFVHTTEDTKEKVSSFNFSCIVFQRTMNCSLPAIANAVFVFCVEIIHLGAALQLPRLFWHCIQMLQFCFSDSSAEPICLKAMFKGLGLDEQLKHPEEVFLNISDWCWSDLSGLSVTSRQGIRNRKIQFYTQGECGFCPTFKGKIKKYTYKSKIFIILTAVDQF